MSERAGEKEGYRSGFVALFGLPNVGKSTLMNRWIGAKAAIVTPKPQTTRHRILGIRTEEHRQFVFVDTPGVYEGKTLLAEAMLRTAWSAALDADVVVVLQDVLQPIGEKLQALIERLREEAKDKPRIHALNKIDRIRKGELLPRIDQLRKLDPEARAYVPISALTGDGTDALLDEIAACLPEQPPLYPEDWWTDQTERQLAAEYVREKLFMALKQEVPFHTAVEVEGFTEEPDRIEIDAVIHVAKNSHKPIVLGKKGARIKEIGIRARQELEALFGKHVRLNLWVKVSPHWYENPMLLHELGIHPRR